MIRQVTKIMSDDADAIKRLGAEFAYEADVDFDYEWALAQISGVLNSGIGALWFMESNEKAVGIVSGVIVPSLYDGNVEVVELFWYVNKEYRVGIEPIRLFSQLETWANFLKAKRIRFMHLESLLPEKLHRFYTHHGYRPIERVYVKELR